MKLTAHIVVRGAERAAGWYTQVFGARETQRVPLPDGRFMALVLAVGDSSLHLADEFAELGVVSPQSLGGTPVTVTFETDDVDAVWQRALAAGAEVVHPVMDAFWGDRHGIFRDPFGHRWGVCKHLRDVPAEDIAREAAKMMGQ